MTHRRRQRGVFPRQRDELCEAEVEDLDQTLAGDHHVVGLQIPVNDPGRVGPGEPIRDPGSDLERLSRGDRSRGDQLAQGRSLDQFHGHVRLGVRPTDLVDRDDVRVIQGRSGTRLPLEAVQALRVRRNLGRQHLQGDLAPEPRVPRPVHLSHPACANLAQDFVRPQTRSGW